MGGGATAMGRPHCGQTGCPGANACPQALQYMVASSALAARFPATLIVTATGKPLRITPQAIVCHTIRNYAFLPWAVPGPEVATGAVVAPLPWVWRSTAPAGAPSALRGGRRDRSARSHGPG